MRWLWILLLCGCYAPKKAERQLAIIEHKYPQMLAVKARQMFPVTADSTQYINWKNHVRTIIKDRVDTLYRVDTADLSALKRELKSAYVFIDGLQKQLENVPNIYYEDSAKLYLYDRKISELMTKNEKSEHSRNFLIYFSSCISGLLILFLIALLISRIK